MHTGQRLHRDGLATLTLEFTPTCLFDGSFSESVSSRCITLKFVSQLVGLPCVFLPCLLFGQSYPDPDCSFSHITIVKASAGMQWHRHQRLRAGTAHNIVWTQLPTPADHIFTYGASRATARAHQRIDLTDNNSQHFLRLRFLKAIESREQRLCPQV